MLNNIILVSCLIISIVTGVLLKKIKKKEIIQSPSKYYYFAMILLNLIVLFTPLSFLKKCFSILLISPLIYQAFLDHETMELSDILSGIILGYGVLYIVISHQYSNFISALILVGIYTILSILGPVGFGDVKLIFGLGLLIENYFFMILFPFVFSIIFEIIIRIINKNKRKEDIFAFGPYIVIGFYFVMLFWENPISLSNVGIF